MTTTVPEVLVVAGPTDGGARAAARLASGGPGLPPLWITADRLASARWSHRVGPGGRTATTVRVPGVGAAPDLLIDSARLRLVWFRARTWRLGVDRPDADYAWSEFTALLVSWLSGLGDRVVNRPDGNNPNGPSWSPARWLAAAAAAGLPVVARTAATSARLVDGWRGGPWEARRPFDDRPRTAAPAPGTTRVLLLDGRPVHEPRGSGAGRPVTVPGPAGARLAAASGCRLLGLLLDASGRVAGVDPCPPLTGPAALAAVAGLLRTAAGTASAAEPTATSGPRSTTTGASTTTAASSSTSPSTSAGEHAA